MALGPRQTRAPSPTGRCRPSPGRRAAGRRRPAARAAGRRSGAASAAGAARRAHVLTASGRQVRVLVGDVTESGESIGCTAGAAAAIDHRQRAQPAFQVPLQQRRHQPGRLPTGGVRRRPRPRSSPRRRAPPSDSIVGRRRAGRCPPNRRRGSADRAARRTATWKAACGPGSPQRAHSVSAGAQPASAIARSRNASSTSDGSRAVSVSARNADTTSRYSRSDGSRSSDGQPLGGLDDRRGAGVTRIVGDQHRTERIERLGLGDDVQVAAGIELQVDVAERLQPAAEPTLGPPHALGHRPDPALAPGQQGDDPIGLAEFRHPQHHGGVAVNGHQAMVPLRGCRAAHPMPVAPGECEIAGGACTSLAGTRTDPSSRPGSVIPGPHPQNPVAERWSHEFADAG